MIGKEVESRTRAAGVVGARSNELVAFLWSAVVWVDRLCDGAKKTPDRTDDVVKKTLALLNLRLRCSIALLFKRTKKVLLAGHPRKRDTQSGQRQE